MTRNGKETNAADGRVARVVWPLVIGLTVLAIWSFSLMSADRSQAQSDFVRQLLESALGPGALTDFLATHFPIRKVAHFTEYFVLGVEWACYDRVRKCTWVWGYGLPVAVTDELLQFTAAGRSPAVADVILDTAGYLCGFWLTVGLLRLADRGRHRKERRAGA